MREPHEINAVARVVVTLLLAFGIASISSLVLLPVVMLFASAVVLTSRHRRLVLRRLRGPCLLALTLMLFVPVISGQTAMAQLGPLAWRIEGMQAAFLIAARMLCIVALTLTLLAPLSSVQLAAALRGLRLPALMSDLALLTLRYLEEIRAELRRAHVARRLRGGASGWRSLPDHAMLLATGLIRALTRSETLWAAMRLRGHGAGLASPAAVLQARDWVGMISAGGIALGLLWLDHIL